MDETLRERAVRLLARREHARTELSRKLAPHAESAEALEAVLDELVARRLLSDERYVEMRLNARGARFGNDLFQTALVVEPCVERFHPFGGWLHLFAALHGFQALRKQGNAFVKLLAVGRGVFC